MTETPFFSFIIPTKNRYQTLTFSIQSCLNQTFEDFEIIVSDNNSTDSTKEVCKNFMNSKIKYYNTYKDIPVQDNFENGLNATIGFDYKIDGKNNDFSFTGGNGGELAKISNYNLNINDNDMLTIETGHLLICHLLTTLIRSNGKPMFEY